MQDKNNGTIDDIVIPSSESTHNDTRQRGKPRKYDSNTIYEAIDNGARTAREISNETGMPINSIYKIAKKEGIELTKGKIGRPTKREDILKMLDEELANNPISLEALCQKLNTSPYTLWAFAKKNSRTIPYENMEPFSDRPEIDQHVTSGLPLQEIGDRVGNTKEFIRQYIQATAQEKLFKEARWQAVHGVKIELANARRTVLSIINNAVDKAAKEQGFATQKTIEYIRSLENSRNDKSIPHWKLMTLFERYEATQNKREKVSLETLGEGLFNSPAEPGRILERVGLEPLYGNLDMHLTPGYKKQAIRNAFYGEMSAASVANLLEVKDYIIVQNWKLWFPNQKRNTVSSLGLSQTDLPYHVLSQIFEARDETDFTIQEIHQYVGRQHTTPKSIQYALDNRQKLEKEVIKQIRIMLPDKNIEKPYFPLKMLEQ